MIKVICNYIIFILNISFFIYNIYKYRIKEQDIIEKIKKEKQLKIQEEEQKILNEYYILKKQKEAEFEVFSNSIQEKIESNNLLLKDNIEKTETLFQQQRELIETKLQNYKTQRTIEIQEECQKIKEEAQSALALEITQYQAQIANYETDLANAKQNSELAKNELNEIKKELLDFQSKRAALNEIQRKEEELAAERDSHRIILSEEDKKDIEYLISIESKIHNIEVLHKLIWSEYLQKPFNQMINKMFGSKIPKNVIYCIQNINTNKKYIGKTTAEVSKRWTEHIKTSLGIGGVKKSKIHSAIFNNWDDFTFSVIETVDGTNLSEREKYYISFFESDKYGYNVKSGG